MEKKPKYKVGDIVKHTPSGQHLGVITDYDKEDKKYFIHIELMRRLMLNETSIELEDRPKYLKLYNEISK